MSAEDELKKLREQIDGIDDRDWGDAHDSCGTRSEASLYRTAQDSHTHD